MKNIAIISTIIFICATGALLFGQDKIKENIKLLKSEDFSEHRRALYELHDSGREAIPFLIEEISNEDSIVLFLGNPKSSQYSRWGPSIYIGVLAAYLIDLIIERDSINENEFFSSNLYLGDIKNYLYWDGVIIRKDNMELITVRDLLCIQKIYRQWWSKNKRTSFYILRKQKLPLEDTCYLWE